MKAAHIDATLTGNMLLDIWKKFVLLSGTSGMTASTRQPLGLIREDVDTRALLFKLMHETIAVGRAAGVDLPEDFAAELDRSIAAFPPTMKASMANDLEAGRTARAGTGWRGRWSRLAVSMVYRFRRRKQSTRSSNLTGRG